MNVQSPITPIAATASPRLSVVTTVAPLLGSTRMFSVLDTFTVAFKGVSNSTQSGSAVGLGVTVGSGASPSSVSEGRENFSVG